MIRWCSCNTTAATASWASVDLDGFLSEQVGQGASRRASSSTKGQEGGRKRQPARCSRKTQDTFAIASMARKLLHRCTRAHTRVVEIHIYMCTYTYIHTYMWETQRAGIRRLLRRWEEPRASPRFRNSVLTDRPQTHKYHLAPPSANLRKQGMTPLRQPRGRSPHHFSVAFFKRRSSPSKIVKSVVGYPKQDFA